MLLTTTNVIEGHKIKEYKGLVTGEVILGTNIVRDFVANFTDMIGGRSSSYENVLVSGRENAIKEMSERAARMGANAVIGIDIDYETVGQNAMMMVSASGTAVVID